MPQQPPYQPIACYLYDYIEAACVHRYEVALTLLDGSIIQGVATDVMTKDKQEILSLHTSEGLHAIRLDSLLRLNVISEPRNFSVVDFSQTDS